MMVFLTPFLANALTVYTYDKFSNLEVGEEKTLKIFFDTEGKEINVLEGKFKINGPAKIAEINTLGSIFSLWPEKPELSKSQEINFTGGVEGGVYGKDLRLFNFIITRIGKGKITINPIEVSAYLNDGKGTKIENENSDILFKAKSPNRIITKSLWIVLVIVILFTLINILRKILKTKNK